MLWSLAEVAFEPRPELSKGASHVAVSMKVHAQARGQACAWPRVSSRLQGTQGSVVGEAERCGGSQEPWLTRT